MRILILGGTRFLGRAITEAAIGRGDTVTLFNRGKTNPGLYPGVETVIGDRADGLPAVAGREWDAVVDVAGYTPAAVRLSAQAFAATAASYVFVSTCSVYADQASRQGQLEGAALARLSPGLADYPDNYGANKALCETAVRDAFGDRALIPRPGLITGPFDPTDRFAYWPRRLARGGRVLAPGDPADPVQFIDARDLAAWIADSIHHQRRGEFNLVGDPMTIGRFLADGKAATFSDAKLTWVPSSRLLAAGASPWMGVPMWIGDPAVAGGINDVDNARAIAAGLTLRPVIETIRDTLAWDIARGGPGPGNEGLTAEEEQRLLAAL